MKNKAIKINLISVILLGFSFNPILIVLAQNYIPPTNTQAQQDAAQSLEKAKEQAKNEIQSIKCDSGQALYDKDGKPVGCVINAQQLNKDTSGKVISAICPQGSQAYYKDTSGVLSTVTGGLIGTTAEFAGCITPPSEVTRASDLTNLGKVSQKVSGYQLAIDIPCSTIAGGQCPKITGPAAYIARLYQFGLMIAGLAAFGSIIYGALKYILSAGSFSSTEEAKDQITQAIYGLILLLGAFLILYTINPGLITLSDPNVPIIDINQIINQGQNDQTTGQNNQILSGGTGSIPEDPLCSVGSYPGLSLTIGGKEKINQSFKCSQCVNNASTNQAGKCECNSGFQYSSDVGYCFPTSVKGTGAGGTSGHHIQ